MKRTTTIVVGASAGGVEALKVLAGGFPSKLRAAVFMVLHIGKGLNGHSELPQILSSAGPLPAIHPRDGQEIKLGTIYVAPADRHMLIASGHIHLSHGPKENRTRPAINPLFRSAAENCREQVTGVILTGLLDDGVAGLAQIKRRGGIAVVQTPESAAHPSMPVNAIRHVPVDHVLPLEEIAALCVRLTNVEQIAMEREEPVVRTLVKWTCPDCRGPLWEERQGAIVEYRCRVGHAYSALALAADP